MESNQNNKNKNNFELKAVVTTSTRAKEAEQIQLLDDKDKANCNVVIKEPKGCIKWLEFTQRMKPQTNAIGPGLMVILFNGQHLGWGVFNNNLEVQTWAKGIETFYVQYAIVSWYLMAILGMLAAWFFNNRLKKCDIYMLSYVLVLVSSVIFIENYSNLRGIILGRMISGYSMGLTYLTILIHGCEVADRRVRGLVVSSIHLCLMVGCMVHCSSIQQIEAIREGVLDPNRSLGFNGLIFIFIGILLIIFFEKESPVYLIKENHEHRAQDVMMRLRSESHLTREIREAFQELKLMILEDASSPKYLLCKENRFPLLMVMLLKVGSIISFNHIINREMLARAENVFEDRLYDYSGMILMGARLTSMTIAMFTIDFNRRTHALASTWISGLILLLIVLFNVIQNPKIRMASFILCILYQFICGMGIGALADIYSTEAFNTVLKPGSIFFTTSLEFLLQTLAIMFNSNNFNISYVLGITAIIMIKIGLLICFKLPDTKKLSLRQARNVFKNFQ